jgi:hypothetical protein
MIKISSPLPNFYFCCSIKRELFIRSFAEYCVPSRSSYPFTLHSMPDPLTTEVAADMHLRQTVMLRAKAVETRKRLLTLSLAQPRQNKEAGFKIRELFIYRDVRYITLHYIIDSFSKVC